MQMGTVVRAAAQHQVIWQLWRRLLREVHF